MEARDAAVGDEVVIMITGMTGKYIGTVIEKDKNGAPIIMAEPEGPFSRLKTGDYILIDRRSSI